MEEEIKFNKNPSIERRYKTKAYDILEAYCDDDQGGDCDNCMVADKYDRQAVVNLLLPTIRREAIKNTKESTKEEIIKIINELDTKSKQEASFALRLIEKIREME